MKAKSWAATNRKQLYLHQSGVYYARLKVNGKLTWRSLRTKVKGVAESKLSELLSSEAVRQELGGMDYELKSVSGLIALRKEQIRNDPSIKGSTKTYWGEIFDSIHRTWPDLNNLKITSVNRIDCERWASRFAEEYSGTRYNNGLSALKKIFALAVEHGIRQTNPAAQIKRVKPSQKDLATCLPSTDEFKRWVNEIRRSPNRWSDGCADLVEFLAYSGLRIGEAKWVKWKEIDYRRGEVVVLGDPENSTKNSEIRRVPIIDALSNLLERIKKRRGNNENEPILEVTTAPKAMKRAAKIVGIAPLTHHDLRHLFATTCIESGVDIPTVSRWLGHKDGGALAMRVYGHLRNEHSLAAAKKVSFS